MENAQWKEVENDHFEDQRFAFVDQQYVYEEYKQRIQELEARCKRLEQVLEEAVANWPLAPIVTTLQALRGISSSRPSRSSRRLATCIGSTVRSS